jgi:glyoxylase-like metal-dependent hydrolase (beta-lactamase superfamily II)
MTAAAQDGVETVANPLSSAFLLLGRRPVLVDTGPTGNHTRVLAALQRLGVAPSDLALIVLTHSHADHVGAAKALRESTGAPVAIHRADAERLAAGGRNPRLPPVGRSRWLPSKVFERQSFSAVAPDVVIDDHGLDLRRYGAEGTVVHTPGHTPGSVSVVLGDGAGRDWLLGDLVSGGFLRRRRPMLPFFAEDLDQVQGSIAAVLARSPRTVYVGHGGPFTGAQLHTAFPGPIAVPGPR